ncbi:hypothetical protein IPL68_08070 [Candidatus Saccharibacteria bacterium]|nr:MAG: hypothetical protein IPL68_08070 [Candidatus Saccharibacteria bacterium]
MLFKNLQSDKLKLELTPLGIYQPDDGQTKTITLRLKAVNYDRTLTDTEVVTYLVAIATAASDEHNATKL